jgi:integrase
MKTSQKKTTSTAWDCNTGETGLMRHVTSGRYYSRFSAGGARTMKALKTDNKEVALLRHRDQMALIARQNLATGSAEAGKATMSDLITKALASHDEDTQLTKKTKTGFSTSIARLVKHWEACFGRALGTMKPQHVSLPMVEQFANYLHSKAKWGRYNSKSRRTGYGAATVNLTVEALDRVMRFAKARGYIFALPFELKAQIGDRGGVRKTEPHKKIQFPTREKIREVFAAVRTIDANLSENQIELRPYLVARANESADLAEFMAYSGARVQEAVTWRWEDERERTVFVRGTKTETSRDREVPKIAPMVELLDRMRARREREGRKMTGPAFEIGQCREALASACKRVGVERWTHHTCRHLFATICIESGVDIPTVSRWLGHADGGALAMKTYGHLRQEHSQAQAAKVTFATNGGAHA